MTTKLNTYFEVLCDFDGTITKTDVVDSFLTDKMGFLRRS